MVVLPEPDSPTRPTTSPRLTVKLTPSMARMTGGFAPNQRASPPKCLVEARDLEQGRAGTRRSVQRARAHAVAHSSLQRMHRVAWPAIDLVQRRRGGRAGGDGVRAARREGAARRQIERIGHVAGNGGKGSRTPSGPRTARRCCRAGRACRDGAGCGRSRATGPVSTTSPAYITATRSAISATTPMLWVTKHDAHAALACCAGRAAGRGSGPGS